ncbi:cell death protein W-like protein [Anopheles sinensis]|uniref:Cell death protein W-like protein n=1 Tax=Anopheles sinensis TaxID=74873 RepID=A0A084W4W0_ANOSI|nr:cell death protein W-like protein [Anopheles sinensis]
MLCQLLNCSPANRYLPPAVPCLPLANASALSGLARNGKVARTENRPDGVQERTEVLAAAGSSKAFK